MKTKQLTWAKTLLFAYKYLGSLCRSIDKTIKNMAVHSFYVGGVWNEENSVYKISEKMISLSNKKIDYINLKVTIEKILKEMNKNNAKLLILRNIKELSIQTVASVLNISERTYYRKSNLALKEFSNLMEKYGYSYQKMEINYWNDKFVQSIYKISDNENFDVFDCLTYEKEILTDYVFKICDC